MPTISAKEASVLAYLAKHPNDSKKRTKGITSGLGGNAMRVVHALAGRSSTAAARKAARGLRVWAKQNEKIAARTVSKSGTGSA